MSLGNKILKFYSLFFQKIFTFIGLFFIYFIGIFLGHFFHLFTKAQKNSGWQPFSRTPPEAMY